MNKFTTSCCALCQIAGVNNNTPKEHFEHALKALKRQKEANVEVGVSTGDGQTSAFVIATPREVELKATLESVGFKAVHSFERRKGYDAIGQPVGTLQMYVINF